MFLAISAGTAVALGALGVFIATRPSEFHVERSTRIAAPPERAYALVEDLHSWRAWSPWENLDPAMQRTYSGAPTGTGAVYAWSSSGKAGAGRMTIQKSAAPSEIVIHLEYQKPFRGENTATFTFTKVAGGTEAKWAADGKNDFIAKAIHVVVDFDGLLGAEFEKGLAAMKAAAEGTVKATSRSSERGAEAGRVSGAFG